MICRFKVAMSWQELLRTPVAAHGDVVLVRENEVVGEDDVYAGECELDLLGCLDVLP